MKISLTYTFLLLIFIFKGIGLLAQAGKPNIILVVVDDMRYDEWGGGGHPYLQTPNIDLLAKEGSVFSRAYHAVPLCSPNRASILTGQYPSRHGIIDNTSRNQVSFMLELFPKYLQETGYRTGHVGKWHMGNSALPRPGYDYWLCIEGQGKTNNPILFENYERLEEEGYITDIFTKKSIDFIQQEPDKPFFLFIGHKAIHPEVVQRDDGSSDLTVPKEFIPAQRHKGTYDQKMYKRSATYSADGSADENKPVVQKALKIRDEFLKKSPAWKNTLDIGTSEKTIRNRAEMMLAVDESLGEIRTTLKNHGLSENTIIMFTSDNGYFFGEHGFSLERRMPYEESVRTPLIIHYPGISNPVPTIESLVLSIDLSATALDIAGISKPSSIQGESLLPLITGQQDKIRSSALIEYFSNENPFPWTAQLDYRVVITNQYKYIKWLRFDSSELYDLSIDPLEQINLINDPKYEKIVDQMHQDLRELQLMALGLD